MMVAANVNPSPFYDMVPKAFGDNLDFREWLIKKGFESAEFAREQRIMCGRDILYWINAYVWTSDPRDERPPERPFITFPKQDEFVLLLEESLGRFDVHCDKSRCVGASWLADIVIDHQCRFFRSRTFSEVSRNADLVDNTDDPDSLMWKHDFIHAHLPPWLAPRIDRRKMKIYFVDTASGINGSSTTGDVNRGGRRRGLFCDEHAAFDLQAGFDMLGATQSVTNSRWFISSPQGVGNAFHELKEMCANDTDPDRPMRHISIHWSDWPELAAGLYEFVDGHLVIHDKDYEFPENYKFSSVKPDNPDYPCRSPWYDRECRRTPIRSVIASELDLSYVGSGSPVFDPHETTAALRQCVAPRHVGDFSVEGSGFDSGKPGHWTEMAGGRFLLWCHLDGRGRPTHRTHYVCGVDVSGGSGASNACLSIIDARTSEQVLEYACANVRPEYFAELAAAVGRWFSGINDVPALMIWEANGPGQQFGDRLVEIGYEHLYFRPVKPDSIRQKISDTPGLHSTKTLKPKLLGDYARATARGELGIYSEEQIKERGRFRNGPNGSIIFAGRTKDASGARAGHGDRVSAAAAAWHAIKGLTVEDRAGPVEINIFSMAYRKQRRDELRRDREQRESRTFVFS